tara:strand:+ start:1118 stop:1291 length:174 start_codon:yes stop_codon:yes gene_type:complete
MLKIHRNPHSSTFGMGRPNLNPMAQIVVPSVRVGERPVYSREEAKKVIQKSLERSKK